MKRAAIAAGVLALLILLIARSSAAAAMLGGAVAIAGVGLGSFAYVSRRSARLAVRQWGRIAAAEICKRCNGWGVLNKNKQPFKQDPRTLAHVMWAHGNRRDCSTCNGRGYYTPRVPANKTPGPVVTLVPADDEPDLLFPGGPEVTGPDDPTKVIPLFRNNDTDDWGPA